MLQRWRIFGLLSALVVCSAVVAPGCGSGSSGGSAQRASASLDQESTSTEDTSAADARRQARAQQRADRKARAKARAKAKRRAEKRRQRQTAPPPAPTPAPQPAPSDCEPGYSQCLDPNASDYDCEGGSGDGPKYVAGPIEVTGDDRFDLDRDGDGVGCE
jgi:hypothetical protein